MNWEVHAKSLKGMKAQKTMRKFLWGDNPTRMKLKQHRKCTSGCCLLCGEKNVALHFLVCQEIVEIVESVEWKREEITFQQKAEKMRVPGFLVQETVETLNGIEQASARQLEHRREIFERQK